MQGKRTAIWLSIGFYALFGACDHPVPLRDGAEDAVKGDAGTFESDEHDEGDSGDDPPTPEKPDGQVPAADDARVKPIDLDHDSGTAANDTAAEDAGGIMQSDGAIPDVGGSVQAEAGTPGTSSPQGGGRLWWTIDYCWENLSGTFTTELSTRGEFKQENEIDDTYPALHGKWYLYRTTTSSTSTYGVVDTASLELLHRMTLDGIISHPKPAPHDARFVLGYYPNTATPVVLDLTTGKVVLNLPSRTFPNGGVSTPRLAWLPDGRILLLYDYGERAVSKMDGSVEALPTVIFPQGYGLGPKIWPSPDGNSYTVVMSRAEGATRNSDVWIGDLRSDKFERFTRTNQSTLAMWSPDSKFIVFDVDSQFTWDCTGITEKYHDTLNYIVPSDARNVSSGTLIDTYTRRGQGLKLLGWTP